ncbi:MAG: hypothetical protein Q9162_001077 [Coniocarpon cinnabarinum]
MAQPSPPGLLPTEIAFLCEMELVTIIPRERLSSLHLLAGATPPLRPPQRTALPLWLALLLKKQRRADIAPPPWLHPHSLQSILEQETAEANRYAFTNAQPLPQPEERKDAWDVDTSDREIQPTPPFANENTASGSAEHLPYHWLSIAQILLANASDDIVEPESVRRLLRDLREVRAAKVRAGMNVLDAGAGVRMNGVGALELGEARGFVTGVVDGLRKIGAAREAQGREEGEERREGLAQGEGSEDEDML